MTPLAYKIILTKPSIPRARDPKEFAQHLKKLKKEYFIIQNTKKAVDYAKAISNEKDLIIVTGSIYTVGEIKASQ